MARTNARKAWARLIEQRSNSPPGRSRPVRTKRSQLGRELLAQIAEMEVRDSDVPDLQAIDIAPVAKPRQTRRDRWRPSPAVERYRAFADELRASGARLPSRYAIEFELPMPASWPESVKAELDGAEHLRKPDWDNLAKAVQDALVERDERIPKAHVAKRWARRGRILIRKL